MIYKHDIEKFARTEKKLNVSSAKPREAEGVSGLIAKRGACRMGGLMEKTCDFNESYRVI